MSRSCGVTSREASPAKPSRNVDGKRMRRYLIGALVGLILLAGCGGDAVEDSQPTASEGGPTTTDPADRSSTNAGAYAFGETYFGNRGNITVSEPRPWDPPSWQGTPEGKRWMGVTVTVENISKRVLDGYNWSFEATANGRSIYASEPGNGVPDILSGRAGTWKVTFKVPEAGTDLVFSVAYGLFDPIYWAGPTPDTRLDLQTFAGEIFTVTLLDTASTAAEVRFCATAPYQGGSIPVTRSPWSLQDQDGAPWPADKHHVDLPGQAYPVEATVNVGDCLQGWIQFDAPPSTTPSGVVYHSDIGGPFTWDLDSTASNTTPALPGETPAETEADWNLPKGFPKVVAVSSLPDQIRNWYHMSGNKEAVAVAPGVWAELSPGATVADVLKASVFDGFCASIAAFERKYMDGAQTAGTCW
jgi:hypothetical protein